jgi:hypothetical protein
VTFLYAAKNVDMNHAIVLMNWVKEKIWIKYSDNCFVH